MSKISLILSHCILLNISNHTQSNLTDATSGCQHHAALRFSLFEIRVTTHPIQLMGAASGCLMGPGIIPGATARCKVSYCASISFRWVRNATIINATYAINTIAMD